MSEKFDPWNSEHRAAYLKGVKDTTENELHLMRKSEYYGVLLFQLAAAAALFLVIMLGLAFFKLAFIDPPCKRGGSIKNAASLAPVVNQGKPFDECQGDTRPSYCFRPFKVGFNRIVGRQQELGFHLPSCNTLPKNDGRSVFASIIQPKACDSVGGRIQFFQKPNIYHADHEFIEPGFGLLVKMRVQLYNGEGCAQIASKAQYLFC